MSIVELSGSDSYPSEFRGVFVHCASFPADWTQIASTLTPYKINAVIGEFLTTWGSQYNYIGQLGQAIAALHPIGIKVYCSMDVLMGTWATNTGVTTSSGYDAGWTCPTKISSRNAIKSQVENLVRTYDIDGFMFDYMRYDGSGMCFCTECMNRFKAETGLTDAVAPTDVQEGGRYAVRFQEWRTIPITELVRDMKSWMLAIKPNLKFTLASWWIYSATAPSYWRRWVGQDSGLWVDRGYLDSIAPMTYTNDASGFSDYLTLQQDYLTGGPQGKIPYYAFITTSIDANSNPYTGMAPSMFTSIISQVRLAGADGFIIWAYGGPGSAKGFPDIRNYLGAVTLPDTLQISTVKSEDYQNSLKVSWTTNRASTNNKVEYSNNPLFIGVRFYDTNQGFNMTNINHVAGTTISSTTPSLIIPNLVDGQTVYFRAQSTDSSGTATSKVYSVVFHSSTTPPPPPVNETSYTVTILQTANGTTTPSNGAHTYLANEAITLSATPNNGYRFDFWTINGVIHTENPLNITVTGNLSITPTFTLSTEPPPDGNTSNWFVDGLKAIWNFLFGWLWRWT